MWFQLPTTQFDTTIWYKVVELLDVLCYLKGMHCIALASKATLGIQYNVHASKEGNKRP
jgi:hypothetical protein